MLPYSPLPTPPHPPPLAYFEKNVEFYSNKVMEGKLTNAQTAWSKPYEPVHDQQSLRSACAYAQSDQSLY